MFQKVLATVIIALVISSCCGHIGGQISVQDVREMKPQKYCGPNLAKTLALLCYEENAGVGKRSDFNAVYNAIAPPVYKSEEVSYWPWLTAEKARRMGLPTRGKRNVGVVDECCFKACSIDELLSYC